MESTYRDFCNKHYLPIYWQPWWLDVVCANGRWRSALASDAGGQIIGVQPWYMLRRKGVRMVQQPPFTSYGGPWLQYPHNPDFKRASRYAYEKKVMGELIAQLPKPVLFRQQFHPWVANHLPFFWSGFRQTTRYTYRFETVSEPALMYQNFKNTLRTDLEKATAAVYCKRADAEPGLIFGLHRQSFSRKGMTAPYSETMFLELHKALSIREQSACWLAFDQKDDTPHAGLYLIFDDRQASVLLTGLRSELRQSSALSLLFWEALQFCAARNMAFDFEGSMDAGIEHAFRSFGAMLTPYHTVWRTEGIAGKVLAQLAGW